MNTPLNASAQTAGALISSATFQVPIFQREYSWLEDEVTEFWRDLRDAHGDEPYFLGLVILTEEGGRKQIVDGQQRILTLSLLAAAIYHEALATKRKALADRIEANFLRSINYETDEITARIELSDEGDNKAFQEILAHGLDEKFTPGSVSSSFGGHLKRAYFELREQLRIDLDLDQFKRLGSWTEFLTNRVYFAVFVHSNAADAYRVYEVINTRGKDLSTADLLKNFVLGQTQQAELVDRYKLWQRIARLFWSNDGPNQFVQYIRHVVTVEAGYIQPQDLYDFLSGRSVLDGITAPSPVTLMNLLQENHQLYLQMVDQTLDGPADAEALRVFSAFKALQVVSVRPLLLAICKKPNPVNGLQFILRLVVTRIAVGNLGGGGIERRFGDAARLVHDSNSWEVIVEQLKDLLPSRQSFVEKVQSSTYNKANLAFLRRSTLLKSITPDVLGTLHFICPKNAINWEGLSEEDAAFWSGTIGNTVLANLDRRPKETETWQGVKSKLLPAAIEGEWANELNSVEVWDASAIQKFGKRFAEAAAYVWY